jgi:hypothetical protein
LRAGNAYALTVASPTEAFGTLLEAAVPIGPSPTPRRRRSNAPPPASDAATPPSENLAALAPAFSLAAEAANAERVGIVDAGDVTSPRAAPGPAAPPGPGAVSTISV